MSANIYAKAIRKLRDLGANKKGIFVCNLDLKKSFNVGDKVECNYDFKEKMITITKTLKNQGTHTISFRKSEPEKPILDLKNKTIYELFRDSEKVEICFYPNKVIVKLSKNENLKNERISNINLTTFELFCGGATLSHMFKRAGFVPVGGLEINGKCLDLAEYNHDFKYTILADIKDVHVSDLPKNINTVLAGIPCPYFSPSNLSMQKALKNKKDGIMDEDDMEKIENRYQAEALTFYVLEILRHMNPQNIVVEEVVEYSTTTASQILRSVLKDMGYKLSETINEGSHTKRKRWCLVATALEKTVNLDDLLPETNKTIEDFLDIKSADRDWKKLEDIQRLLTASKKSTVGIRTCLPTDTKCNTFTTHRTRSTEQALKKSENEDLYSEFTDSEIANIHGLVGYKLKNVAKWNRYVLGNGVTDMFYEVAKRIKRNMIECYRASKENNVLQLVS